MGWVCRFCSTNNENSDSQCIVCDKPKSTSSVCTLTAKRVRDLGLHGDVIIPLEFNVIGEDAFLNRTDITSVTLHEDIKKISRSAFSGCKNLRSVISPIELDNIGSKAFFDCLSLRIENRPRAKKVAIDAYEVTFVCPAPSVVKATYSPPMSSVTKRESAHGAPTRIVAGLILAALSCVIIVPLIIFLISSYGWTAWQWIIGIVGGAVLPLTVLVFALMLEGYFETYSSASVMIVGIMLINLLLLHIFKGDYLIISSIFSFVGALGSGFVAYISFDYWETGWGIFDIIVSVSNIVVFVMSLILFH